MYNEVIILVKEENSRNQYGDLITVKTEREVFADLKSIGQSEFYQAAATGLKPELKFVLPDFLDYEGEKVLKYRPFSGVEEEYRIIRTYRNGNLLELTAGRGVDE